MTRQKKELIRQILKIEEKIATDQFFSHGCAPANAYDRQYEQIDALEEQLARLMHYDSADAMRCDIRGLEPDIFHLSCTCVQPLFSFLALFLPSST